MQDTNRIYFLLQTDKENYKNKVVKEIEKEKTNYQFGEERMHGC